ncbi:MAG: hypothetical protein HOV79_24010 [Hamadaea sp.]|nr:hypothetical protein [Hamadaea sp.]
MTGGGERAELSAVDDYLRDLERTLRGPRRAKSDLLREARGGLVDAVEALEDRGLPTAQAQQRAIADFGPVRRIAPAYQAELATAQSRRTSLLILGIFLAQCFLWEDAVPAPGDVAHGWLMYAVKWGGGVVMLATIGVVWLAGRGARQFGVRREAALLTGWFGLAVTALFTAMGVGLTVLQEDYGTMLGLSGFARTGVFLLLPLAVVAMSARQCLRAGAGGRPGHDPGWNPSQPRHQGSIPDGSRT